MFSIMINSIMKKKVCYGNWKNLNFLFNFKRDFYGFIESKKIIKRKY